MIKTNLLRNCFFALLALIISCSSNNNQFSDINYIVSASNKMVDEGKISDADFLLRKSLAIFIEEDNKLNQAICLKNLGNIYTPKYLNVVDSAMRFYEKAEILIQEMIENLDVPQKLLLENSNILNNKAVLYHYMKNYDKAIKSFEQVLNIDETIDNLEGKSKTLMNLGRVYRDKWILNLSQTDNISNLELSLNYFRQALTINESPDIYLNMARTYQLQGKFAEAIANYSIAAEMYEEKNNNQWYGITLGNIGILLANNPKSNLQAIDSLKKSISLIEKIRGSLTSDFSRSVFFDDKVFYYEYLIKLLVEENRLDEAFEYIERAKARSLLDLLSDKEIRTKKKYPQEIKLLIENEKQLSKRISRIQQIPDSNSTLILLTNEYDILIKELAKKEPEYASLISVQPEKLSVIKNQLENDTAILEYFIGINFSVVLYIDNESIAAKQLNLENYNLTNEIEALHESFIKYNDDLVEFKYKIKDEQLSKGNYNWLHEWKREWQNQIKDNKFQFTLLNLFGVLVGEELAEKIKSKERLIIIPHGILHHFPFGTLISSPGNLDLQIKKHLVRPKYLLEEKEIIVLPSSSILNYTKMKVINKKEKALIVGNPIYPSRNWANLPGAEKEAQKIANFFNNPTLLKSIDATETKIKSIASDYDIIHFATHGQFLESALQSRILFTKSDSDDGYLTANEIFDLTLDANLVVLSACQSGQVGGYIKGKMSHGDDLVGLIRSFFYAGASSIISTLWYVDDSATASALEIFYDKYIFNKFEKSKSLRLAQLEILNNKENEDWKHPYYWAPFFLTGSYK
jgi:CHAT domain-containing protein/tetratricopeptide (TPR) repeat protein